MKIKQWMGIALTLICSYGWSQDTDGAGHDNAAAQANNPLANMTAFNIQDYYVPKLTNTSSDAYLNTAWLRLAKPFADGRLLLRVSTPLPTVGSPAAGDVVSSTSGLSDINAFIWWWHVSSRCTHMGL